MYIFFICRSISLLHFLLDIIFFITANATSRTTKPMVDNGGRQFLSEVTRPEIVSIFSSVSFLII